MPRTPSISGPMQQTDARNPATSGPSRLAGALSRTVLGSQIPTRILPQLLGTALAARHVVATGVADMRTALLNGEHYAADRALREPAGLRTRLPENVLGVVFQPRGTG